MDLKGKSVAILGMARSGLAAAKLVKKIGGIPFVSDHAASDNLKTAIDQLESMGIEYETGDHSIDRLSRNDLIVLSPGIAIEDPVVNTLLDSGREVISELELAARLLPCPKTRITSPVRPFIDSTTGKARPQTQFVFTLFTVNISPVSYLNKGIP